LRAPGRREFLRNGLLAAGGLAGLAAYACEIEPHWIEFSRRSMPVAGLPPALAGARILHLSDLHVGPRVSETYQLGVLRRAAALNADFVVFTGDLVTWRGAHPLERLGRVVPHLPRGRLGTFLIPGNHDYGPGWSHPEIAREVLAFAERAGASILRNERVTVAGLTFVGMDDLWSGQLDIARALSGLPAGTPAIALCHNPDACDLPGWEPFRGWILAGHTHGGQVRPPFLPPPLLPVRNHRYAAGEVDLGAGRRLYVSRGIGHLLQVRFNVRPEVTVFTLAPA
jgi:predicted MPP superfamily phosphohydrolase